jgi:hypothetical protein
MTLADRICEIFAIIIILTWTLGVLFPYPLGTLDLHVAPLSSRTSASHTMQDPREDYAGIILNGPPSSATPPPAIKMTSAAKRPCILRILQPRRKGSVATNEVTTE